MRAYIIGLASFVAVTAIATPCAAQEFRAELHGGWDRVNGNDDGDNGLVYGIGLGYDHAIGDKAFIGVDFSLDDSTQRECETSAIVTNDRLCVRAGRDIAAGIRAGTRIGEAGKLYALAGYTNARFKARYTTAGGVTTSEGENLDGFRLGAGYQHRIAGGAYGKVEYRYSNYEAGTERHQVLFGVGVEF